MGQVQSINGKKMMTAMFYRFLAPEGGHPSCEEHFIEKQYQNARCFFLSHMSKLNQQKSEMLFQKVQQIYTRLINMISSPYVYD